MSTCSVFQYFGKGQTTNYEDGNIFCCLPTTVVSINIKRPYFYWNVLLSCYNFPIASAYWNSKLNIPTFGELCTVCISLNWLHGTFPLAALWCFSCNHPHSYSIKRLLLGGIDRTFSAGQWHLSLAGCAGWDSMRGRWAVTMGGEVPLMVVLASHWINTKISQIYTSAFVAKKPNWMLK